MRLTQTLLGFLNRAFDKDPDQFLALRITYDGSDMTWQVQDGILTTAVNGGSGVTLTIDLSQFTVLGLAEFVTVQQGYDVPFIDPTNRNVLSARVLIDGSGDTSLSNGDHLYGYKSLLWAYLEANAVELDLAEKQIEILPLEMATTTADGFWLDFLGNFYGIPRNPAEPDSLYGPRIIATILAPRGNNKAIEIAIKLMTSQDATVLDAPISGPGFPVYDGAIVHDGTFEYHSTATRRYGLFDVIVGFDLLGNTDPNAFIVAVRAMLDAFRDAGTHVRQFTLGGSVLTDTFPATATQVQAALGMTRGAAFDIQAVCSGFVFALAIADSFIRTSQARCVLVIGAETFSKLLDWDDRSTCVLFGDGAGAMILTASSGDGTSADRGVLSTHLFSDGRYRDQLYVDGGPSSTGTVGHLRMQGREVFRHAVVKMAEAIDLAIAENKLAAADIDWLVPHQANKRIIEATAERMGLPMERVMVTIQKFGNTTAGTIPLSLWDYEERLKEGDRMIFAAFGGGFTWAGAFVTWGYDGT